MDQHNPFSGDQRQTPKERETALRRKSLKQSWPVLIMIPMFQGIVYAASWSLLLAMFLGKEFGLSQGHDYPWPGGVAVLYLVSFWFNRFVSGRVRGANLAQALSAAAWIAATCAWIWLDPAFDDTTIWSHPGELVSSQAFLIPLILVSMATWWLGLSFANSASLVGPEDERFVVQRAWFVLFGSFLVALAIGGDIGSRVVSIARFAVPILLIASLSLVAGAEVESTRRLAERRGGQLPSWDRWIRLVVGFVVVVTVLTLIVLLIFSPEVFSGIAEGTKWAARWVGFVLGYILYAIVWALFQVFNGIAAILHAIFGDMFGPVKPPEMPSVPGAKQMPQQEQGEVGSWKYAYLARWGVLGVGIAVGMLLLFRFTRRKQADDGEDGLEEQRDSVFSTDLAKQQLRDLFRRRQREAQAKPLNLNQPPQSVRESMVYLQTLAGRQQVARRPGETAIDFAARLRAVWPGVGKPLIDLGHAYQEVRYGDRDDPPSPATMRTVESGWTEIWNRRKDWVPPPPEDDDKKKKT